MRFWKAYVVTVYFTLVNGLFLDSINIKIGVGLVDIDMFRYIAS